MIQIPQTARPTTGLPADEPLEQAEAADPWANPAGGVAGATGDPIARFGALNTLHQFAYASPDGGGGGGRQETKAKAGASANDKPITATGQKGGQQWMDRGVQLLKQGRYDEALAAFEEGFRTYPDPNFLLNKASTLYEAGRYAEAVLAYDTYLSDPNASRADDARAALERAREKLGGREVTTAGIVESGKLFSEGVAAYSAGRYEEALARFEQAYEKNPLADTKYNQAACLDRLGLKYAAAARYGEYLTEKPNAADAAKVTARIEKLRAEAPVTPITASGIAGGQEWMSRGVELLRAGRNDEAVSAFQEGFRTYPDARFILNEAAALLNAGRFAEADLAYSRYLSDPNAPRADEARAAQARAREAMGGREATATGIAESARQFEAGTAHYNAGRYGDALRAFEQAFRLNPRADIKYNEAAGLDKMGLRELAADRYRQYIKMAPQAKDVQKVEARITKLHAEATNVSRAAFDRGQEAMLAGRYRDAAGAFAEAYEAKPLPAFLYDRGQAFDKAGDTPRAVQAYQQYLDMAPDAPDASRVRARIEELQNASGNGLMKP